MRGGGDGEGSMALSREMTSEAEAAAREAAEAVIRAGKGDGTDLASVVLMAATVQSAQAGVLTMDSHVERTQALHSEIGRAHV